MVIVGPLTNLAIALKKNSKLIVDKIEKIYIMVQNLLYNLRKI